MIVRRKTSIPRLLEGLSQRRMPTPAAPLPGGPAGPAGPAGVDGTIWYSGEGAPSGPLGVDGDFYLRISNSQLYKKVAGAWVEYLNIKGATGEKGEKGDDGDQGEKGEPGEAGPEGPVWTPTFYRLIHRGRCRLESKAAAGFYRMSPSNPVNVLHNAEYSSGGADNMPDFIRLDPSLQEVPGHETKCRIRLQLACNETKPGGTTSVQLYPMVVAGGANKLNFSFTTGSPVGLAASLVGLTTAANAVSTQMSEEFTIPALGTYGLLVNRASAVAENSAIDIVAELLVRNV